MKFKYPISAKALFKSITFDIQFLKSNYPLNAKNKLKFLVSKYSLLLKHYILAKPIHLGKSKITLSNNWFYYETPLGISPFQTMIVDFEKYYLPHLKHLYKPIIFDIGAHIGCFSLTTANFFPKSKVFAFEPVNTTFNLLKNNLHKNSQVILFNFGFADKNSRRKIYIDPNYLAFSSLFSKHFSLPQSPTSQIANFKTLDSFIAQNAIQKIDLIKIDAEGAEEKILLKAGNTLKITKFLIIECSHLDKSQLPSKKIFSLISNKEHRFQLLSQGLQMYSSSGELKASEFLFKNSNLD